MEVLFQHIVYLVLISICILLSAFFSGAETALVSAQRISIETGASKGKRNAVRSLYILDNIEDAIGMVLVGNNIANIAATAFITFVATRSFALGDRGLLIVTAVQTLVFLIFCEISPKVIARAKAESFLLVMSLPIKGLIILLKPLTKSSLLFSNLIKRIFKIPETSSSFVRSRDELGRLFRMGEEEGVIEEEHQQLVDEILSFREVTAYEVMTPTIDIKSVEEGSSLKKLVQTVEETHFSRIPLYSERVDNITGYIFYRDILRKPGMKNLSSIMYRAWYIPGTKNIFELFLEMKKKNVPMVFVVNEHGAVVGLVTHEDIAEEVVGEIQTKDHTEEELIAKINDKEYLLSGDLDIEHFQKVFPVRINKKGFETIAGFITWQLGRIPAKGERFEHDRITFIVEEATERSVEKVRLKADSKIRLKK